MIKQIQIARFKNFRDSGILKLGRVNMLAGANGCGKSSFCQVLLTLAQTWREGGMNSLLPKGVFKNLGTFDDIHYAYTDDGSIDIHLWTEKGKDNDFLLKYVKNEDRRTLGEIENAEVNGVSIFDEDGENEDDDGVIDDGEDANQNMRLTSLKDYPSLTALQNLFYISADRTAASNKEGLDETTPDDYIKPDGSNVLNVLWAHREENILEDIAQLIKDVLESGTVQLIPDNNELVLTLNSISNSKLFMPVNVGYGYSYILSLLTALVIAKPGATFIVENPEAHLHPSAQAKIAKVLIDYSKKKNLQMFVETHSDHVLNALLKAVKKKELSTEDMQLLFFSCRINEEGHTEGKVENLKVTGMGHIQRPPKKFFEQYALDLRELYSPTEG